MQFRVSIKCKYDDSEISEEGLCDMVEEAYDQIGGFEKLSHEIFCEIILEIKELEFQGFKTQEQRDRENQIRKIAQKYKQKNLGYFIVANMSEQHPVLETILLKENESSNPDKEYKVTSKYSFAQAIDIYSAFQEMLPHDWPSLIADVDKSSEVARAFDEWVKQRVSGEISAAKPVLDIPGIKGFD